MITGSLIQAYIVCRRQAWLLSRQLVGDQDNDFIVIGRLISKESYKNSKKEIVIDGGKIDIVKKERGFLKLVEVKKSSKMIKSAKFQLLFYMWKLNVYYGEIRIPKEKKVIEVEMTDDNEKQLLTIVNELEETINNPKMPKPERKSYCSTCSFEYFCWS
ncbi:CRISPR-associated protein Cas4 [Thermosipho melanesiensis]|uniref:CRISPR-associated exonuclease Cas4 n=2 Tax=Thermosipho melanesiensis TaxID=46541 RepID=A6LJW8_THEM4|nr:CRISPR-associated protein Cas4 [Thermosipho melanesiensis]ABR30219.1 CRISPR-associated protein Cas4 [Thermosipho melanesiensis BI429]APT73415.1 CRISPR-associated protein Cas4 [Thermosipho melanesiensis]OOC37353.1 CRISPR-associated protein Cas4 [Thermosipho melanesiensis]OOC39715.1 CRISPR-associated protein Cas4 [Thermosipho melanesiensis]OOC39820.1 CRISPR-associated protein Cas4 [Thermosipho melanesiensis]